MTMTSFVATGASVLAIAPENAESIAGFIKKHPVPFQIVSDADNRAFDAYDVASRALSLGNDLRCSS